MRKLTILTIGLFLFINYSSGTKTNLDSNFYAIESNDSLRRISLEILNGRDISTLEISTIYQIIDSVLSKIPSERKFYFKVFNEIDRQAKGELAVEMDWKIKEFCYKYPNDFFNISGIQISEYAQRIGELLRTQEEYPEKATEDYIAHILKIADTRFKKEINAFSLELMKKIKGRK